MQENAVRVHSLSHEQLYERVWSTPMQRLAAEFGFSDVGLCKICYKQGIPTPPRGYWMMSDARKTALRPPFPPQDAGSDEPIVIRASPSRGSSRESPVCIEVVVPGELVDLRPVIAATVRAFRSGKRGDNGLLIPRERARCRSRSGRRAAIVRRGSSMQTDAHGSGDHRKNREEIAALIPRGAERPHRFAKTFQPTGSP